MGRVASCRLNETGIAAIRAKYRQGRWANVTAFCKGVGIPRSSYYIFIDGNEWLEQQSIEAHLTAIGIREADWRELVEYKTSVETAPEILPQYVTSFIGRTREVKEVVSILGTTRHLTVTGAGGCGKTRLALEVAARVRDLYTDGVVLVKLELLSDESLISCQILKTLGVSEQPLNTDLDTAKDYLETRRVLLVLDNCEHLLHGSASVVKYLLETCSKISVLTTSREPLNISGEEVWRIPSLPFPDPDRLIKTRGDLLTELKTYDAPCLFLERAEGHRSGLQWDRQCCQAVAEICARLDGIPLAIELVAAYVRVMNVNGLTKRLKDGFHLPGKGSRDAPPRQQTINSAIESLPRPTCVEILLLIGNLAVVLLVLIIMLTIEDVRKLCDQGPDAVFAAFSALQSSVISLEDKMLILMSRIKELEDRLGKDSHNSSKPPSSDGFKKPKSLRPKGGRPSGGQRGHPGRTLEFSDNPDTVVVNAPSVCEDCGAPLADVIPSNIERRQVFELPPPPLVVTEHQLHTCPCPACGKANRASAPEGVDQPVQYDPRVKAIITYLMHFQLLPFERAAGLMDDLFGAPISEGTLCTVTQRASAALVGVEKAIVGALKNALFTLLGCGIVNDIDLKMTGFAAAYSPRELPPGWGMRAFHRTGYNRSRRARMAS